VRRFQQRIHNFLYIEESTLARVYVGGVSGLIVLNILSVFVESWDEERVNYWGRDQRIPQQAYDVFEACSVAVFTLDYILRLYSAARAASSVAVRRTVICAYLTATRDPTPPPTTHTHSLSLSLSLSLSRSLARSLPLCSCVISRLRFALTGIQLAPRLRSLLFWNSGPRHNPTLLH
jgi:hypothetical protein